MNHDAHYNPSELRLCIDCDKIYKLFNEEGKHRFNCPSCCSRHYIPVTFFLSTPNLKQRGN